MKKLLPLVLLLSACTPLMPASSMASRSTPVDPECQHLSDAHMTYGALGAGSGALSGVGGLSAAFGDNRSVQLGLGLTALVFGATAAVTTFLAAEDASAFTQLCTMSK
jgi:hypothetical protein